MLLVVLAHPSPDSLSDALAEAYVQGARAAGAEVELLPLRDLEFDPYLREGFSGAQELEPDLRNAQLAIERAAHVAWFFPTWWAGAPALLKGFVDRTFLPGWSFVYRRNQALPDALLKGRSARVVTTMDSPNYWYWLWHRSSVHTSFVNATLRFVGFGPIACTTFFDQRTRSPEQRQRWLERMEKIGRTDAIRSQKQLLPVTTHPNGDPVPAPSSARSPQN